MIKAYAGRKQYVDKKGLDLLDKAIDKMMKEDIALDELEEQMFGDKEEVNKMIDSTNNLKHRLVIMFLYYAGLRLDEARNLRWLDIDFDREIIHLKTAKTIV